jgi:hypothetical protein
LQNTDKKIEEAKPVIAYDNVPTSKASEYKA